MKKRESNIELLRIVAILLIIVFHISYHCIYNQLSSTESIALLNNGIYSNPYIYKRLYILALISPLGQIGNALFMLITGYFMISKKDINITKITKKLLLQLVFASICLGITSIIIYNYITEYSLNLVLFNSFNELSWYIGYYFLIVLFAILYLNKFLNKIDKKKYIMFLMILLGITQFSWSIYIINDVASGLIKVFSGILLYSLGGYIKKYKPFNNIKIWALILLGILINFIVIGDFYINTASNINNYIDGLFIQQMPHYTDNQLLPISLGLIIFELFRRIKISYNKVINYIGASTFMIYLLHDNALFYSMWNTVDWITLLYTNIFKFIGIYLLWTCITFVIGLIVYFLYNLITKLYSKYKYIFIKSI